MVQVENGARLSRALQRRFIGPHRLLHARGVIVFEFDAPDCLRISRTCNATEFKRDQVDHSCSQPRIHQCESLKAVKPSMR